MLKTVRGRAKANAAPTTGRGRIPRAAWPAIVSRRDDGEPISCIARSYGVTPGAVNYVLKKSDAAKTPEPEETGEQTPEPKETGKQTPEPEKTGEQTPEPEETGKPEETGEPEQPAPPDREPVRSPHAARLAAAAETCCTMLDASGPVMTHELKAAIHEVRRSLAAIEIAAAQQKHSRAS